MNTRAIQALTSGDFLIDLTGSCQNLEDAINHAAHGAIYKGYNEIIHAASSRHGKVYSKVRTHDIERVFERERNLGSALAFHCENAAIQSNIEQLISQKNIADTPFITQIRRKDNTIVYFVDKLEFYRAFRAYDRIVQNQPLSKNKGVSCSNFISYNLKTAIIMQLFPQGLPANVKDQLQHIEHLRKNTYQKKLDKVPINEIFKFIELVSHHLSKEKIASIEFQDLYRLVKNADIGDFCKQAVNKPTLWKVGFFYYQMATPSMMAPQLYNSAFNTKNRITLSNEEIDQAVLGYSPK